MKKFLRYLLYLLGAIVSLVILFVLFIQFRGIPNYEAKEIAINVVSTPQRIAQGKKLASMLCVKCHLNTETQMLTGHFLVDAPELFGKIYSKNITQSKEHGIANWTDGQLAYFLRTGVRPNGSFVPMYMPKFIKMADSDIESIIAWLHSDDPMLAASESVTPPSEPSWFTKFLSNVAVKPIPYDGVAINIPDTTNAVEHGKYMATSQLQCYACHSGDFAKLNDLNPEKSFGFFGGGNSMLDYDSKVIYTANITMDEETGIGAWTEDEFLKAMKTMQTPQGKILNYPMEPYAMLNDTELKHIYAYLKTVPVLRNRVVKR
jgi:cytochrome c2